MLKNIYDIWLNILFNYLLNLKYSMFVHNDTKKNY